MGVTASKGGKIAASKPSGDGSILVTGSDDNTARVWSTSSEKCECQGVYTGHSKYISTVLIRGNHIVTGSADATVRKWVLSTCECAYVYEGHKSTVTKVVADGDFLFSCSFDQTIRCWSWDVQTRFDACLRVFKGHTANVFTIVFCNFDNLHSTGGDVKKSEPTALWNLQQSKKENLLVSGSSDFTARSWAFASGRCSHVFSGHTAAILCMATSGDFATLYTGSGDKTVRSWSLETGDHLKVFQGHKAAVLFIQVLYTCSGDGTAKAWLIEFAENSKTYRGHQLTVTAMLHQGGLVFTVSGDTCGRVFDAKSGALLRTFSGHKFNVTTLEVSNAKMFTGGCDSTLRVWSLAGLVGDKFAAAKPTEKRTKADLINDQIKESRENQVALNSRNSLGSQLVQMCDKKRIVALDNPVPTSPGSQSLSDSPV